MENMTKEQNYKCLKCGVGTPYEVYHTFFGLCNDCVQIELTASGSVSAPKEEYKLDDAFVKMMDKALIDTLSKQLESLRHQLEQREEALKELLPIAEQYRTKIDNPNWEDDFNKSKAIIEKARKLISK